MNERETLLFQVDLTRPDRDAVKGCAAILRAGGLVAFPTETVYGLGADARSPEAVRKIFKAKGRPADNPLIVHTADAEEAFSMARDVPPTALAVARQFWPGPLTLILRKNDDLPAETTAGLDTFGVRVPAHPIALMLLREANLAVAAPSANVSGKPSPTSAHHVIEDLWGKIDAILDGGDTDIGLESTVLDMTVSPPAILRPGAVTMEDLSDVIPDVRFNATADSDDAPRSPGVKYRHYAPEAPAHLMYGRPEEVAQIISRLEAEHPYKSRGYIVSEETEHRLKSFGLSPVEHRDTEKSCYVVVGSRASPEEVARRLYGALRTLDRQQVDEIYIETLEVRGIGTALFDRMHRATSP